jgi:hypothetical protein
MLARVILTSPWRGWFQMVFVILFGGISASLGGSVESVLRAPSRMRSFDIQTGIGIFGLFGPPMVTPMN